MYTPGYKAGLFGKQSEHSAKNLKYNAIYNGFYLTKAKKTGILHYVCGIET